MRDILLIGGPASLEGGLNELRNTNAIRKKSLLSNENDALSDEQLEAVAEHLRTRLKAISEVERQIQMNWDEYRNSHRELDAKHEELDSSRNQARLMFLVWVQAHRKMASGTVDPSDWFDVSGVPETLISTGLRVVL